MKYDFIIKHMSLEEKASLMSGRDCWHTESVERIGLPSVMMTDGPHGLRKQAGEGDHLGLGSSVPATCYPTAAGLANTWDEELIERMGEHLGREAAAENVAMVLGPGVNIKRSPLCGRNFEYFSEDPYLSGKMAAALIRGIQSNGVYACVKHFAANSQERQRMNIDSVMDERTLREIYLPAFEMAVKEGGVKAVMTSYNKLNGTYSSENTHLLRDILYNEWGFKGLVVTDWGADNDRIAGLKAGLSLEMPSTNGITDRQIIEAVMNGELDESILDEQVDRVLALGFSAEESFEKRRSYDKVQHHLFAQSVAEETAVLLKNEDGILPVKGRDKKVAVIGDFAFKPRYQGAGSSKVRPSLLVDDPVDCLRQCGMTVKGAARGFRRGGRADKKLLDEAVALAEGADIVLMYLGLDEGGEAECVDRENMLLPENQLRLLKAVSEVNKNIVVVLSCGCSVEMQWHKYAKAIIHGYLGGQAAAMAMARLLTGKVSPSGKLSETVPLNLAAVPCSPYYPGRETTAEYRESVYVGYRYYDSANVPAMYPFGYGLSYTSFEYSGLRTEGDRVYFTVKNTGDCPGAEVAQLYVSAHTGGMFRPKKELKGFKRVYLQPGEKKELCIELSDRSFAVWSIIENNWVTEPGEYEILIAASSTDIRLRTTLTKTGEPVENPYVGEEFAPYYSADVMRISKESFRALLGRKPPRRDWNRYKPLGVNDSISQGEYLGSCPGRRIYKGVKLGQELLNGLGLREAANNLNFVMNMPYRAVGRMTGRFDDNEMKAIMKLVNGDKRGKEEFIAAAKEKRRNG
ncbi:MAG: glycoside hydrolase family 3 C-terminal domain-containing protein [Candidatus Limivicinus sp.]|jgi:beta-glucosidase